MNRIGFIVSVFPLLLAACGSSSDGAEDSGTSLGEHDGAPRKMDTMPRSPLTMRPR